MTTQKDGSTTESSSALPINEFVQEPQVFPQPPETQIQGLMDRLMAIQAVLHANLTAQAKQFGLTVTQSTVAQYLGHKPGSTLQEVARGLGWPKSTVSRVVDDLVNRKIALREIPASNRRTVLLSLDHAALGCVPEGLDKVFPGGVPDNPQEIQTLRESLDRLLQMLHKS